MFVIRVNYFLEVMELSILRIIMLHVAHNCDIQSQILFFI